MHHLAYSAGITLWERNEVQDRQTSVPSALYGEGKLDVISLQKEQKAQEKATIAPPALYRGRTKSIAC